MAFRLVDGKIMKVDGKFSFRKGNTLTFTVTGSIFPNNSYSINDTLCYFKFRGNTPNNVIVDWGDGFTSS